MSCSTVNVSVMGLIAGAACQIQILPSPSPPCSLSPLPLHFWAFSKGCWRRAGLITKRKWWLLKQSCVSWDYWDFVAIHKESEGNRSAFKLQGSHTQTLYSKPPPHFLTQYQIGLFSEAGGHMNQTMYSMSKTTAYKDLRYGKSN